MDREKEEHRSTITDQPDALPSRRMHELQSVLSTTLSIMRAGYIYLDREGCVTDMNEAAQSATGWPLAEAKGVSIWQVFQREDRPADFLSRNPLDLVQEQSWQLDEGRTMVLVSRHGARLRTDVRAAVTRDEAGSVDGMVVVFRDQSQLFESQTTASRFAAIVDSSHDAIVGKSLDGRITSWNGAAEALFGYSVEEAVGMPVTRLIPLERRQEEMMILERIGRGERIPGLQTERLTKDGRRIDVALTISPVRDGDGRIVGAAKIVRDISVELGFARARERMDVLERQSREMQEASRARSVFFASVSHELRTPLNAVIGFAQLLQEQHAAVDESKRQTFVGHILQAGRHLLQVINDLLELSKAEVGKIDFAPAEFDLRDVVREMAETMRPLAERKGHQLVLELDPDVTSVVLDATRIKQVLYNYLSNAIKFTPSLGTIVVRTRASGPRAFVLEVQDNGIGLTPEEQSGLFEEFQQLRRQPGQDEVGTGLGLALTRRLALAQGGTAGVWSEVGRGSRFFVVLPRLHRLPADRGGRVVVVDDDSTFTRELMGRMAQAGYEVQRLSDVDEAIEVARGADVDAIVLGLEVGGRSGLELLAGRTGNSLAPVSGINVLLESDLGATFPVADVLVKPSSDVDIERALALCIQGGRRPSVLVVDDDHAARALLAEQLHRLGVEVRLACSGEDALAQLDRELPDLIILDLVMEGMSGFDVLSAIRQRPAVAHLPVCIWTALTLSAEQHDGLRRSAARVLLKGQADIQGLLAALFAFGGRRSK